MIIDGHNHVLAAGLYPGYERFIKEMTRGYFQSLGDLPAEHDPMDEETNRRFGEFTAAYDEALTATSTDWAPWYVIPADRNWVRNLAVATVLVEGLRLLDPQFPDRRPG